MQFAAPFLEPARFARLNLSVETRLQPTQIGILNSADFLLDQDVVARFSWVT